MNVVKGFFQNLLGKSLLKLFGFITFPLLTFEISVEEMGIFQLLFGGLGVFVELAALGTRQQIGIDYFKNSSLYDRLGQIQQNLWVYTRISSLVFLALLPLLILWVPAEFRFIALFAVVWAYMNMFNELYLSVVRFHLKFFRFNLTSLFFGTLQFLLVLGLVLFLKLKLLGLVLAYLLTEAAFLSFSLIASRRELCLIKKLPSISLEKAREHLSRTWVFIPSVLSFWLLMNIDQWMLGSMLGLESVGLYALAARFSLLFDFLISSSFFSIFNPYLFDKMRLNYPLAASKNIKFALLATLLSVVVCTFGHFASPLLKNFIGEKFWQALPFIAPLLLAAALRFSSGILQLGVQFKNKIAFLMWANVAVCLLNGVLNALLIPKFGIDGCLFATNVSFVVLIAIILIKQRSLLRARTV